VDFATVFKTEGVNSAWRIDCREFGELPWTGQPLDSTGYPKHLLRIDGAFHSEERLSCPARTSAL
jgi:hypothetical protein